MQEDVRAARAGLSSWLTSGREARGWSREHVARVTRIPMRTLENLEDGRWSELPADVFVRGFLRGYARCVGLSIEDALAQYAGCGFAAAPVASAQAHALLDSMAPLTAPVRTTPTPITSTPRILGHRDEDAGASASLPQMRASGSMPAVSVDPGASGSMPAVSDAGASGSMRAIAQAVATIALPDAPPAGGRRRHKRAPTVVNAAGSRERDARGRFVRRSVEMAAVADPTIAEAAVETNAATDAPQLALGSVTRTRVAAPAIEAPAVDAHVIEASAVEASAIDANAFEIAIDTNAIETAAIENAIDPNAIENAIETAGDADVIETASEPATSSTTVVPPPGIARFVPPPRRSVPMAAPSLVIDDDDPDDAERAREQRAQAQKDGGWRSFLPPALLDQERGGRQGGLTLAVIILLIVATLTLSYLMRRPSSTGEGVTQAPSGELRV